MVPTRAPAVLFGVGWPRGGEIRPCGGAPSRDGMRAIGLLFSAAAMPRHPATAVAVLCSFRRNLYAGGALAALIGIVHILDNMADPSAMGPGLAIALLGVFSAVLLAELVCRPAAERVSALMSGQAEPEAATEPEAEAMAQGPAAENAASPSGNLDPQGHSGDSKDP